MNSDTLATMTIALFPLSASRTPDKSPNHRNEVRAMQIQASGKMINKPGLLATGSE